MWYDIYIDYCNYQMGDKKDYSTAIMDSKSAPNKLMVLDFIIVLGGWSSERIKLICSDFPKKDVRIENI